MRVADRSGIAALPMYDFDGLKAAHDLLWAAIAARLADAHVDGIPPRLTREMEYTAMWRHPRLLFGQGCEYPLATSFAGSVRVVATPHYGVLGCDGARYSSAIVVHRDHPAVQLADVRGGSCVVNAIDSNSGMNLLRLAIARLPQDRSNSSHFFRSVTVSGAHRRSAEMVASGSADVAALDCVTLAHLQRLYPMTAGELRVLDWTPSSPALPFITARTTSDATLQTLRIALQQTLADPALAAVCSSLHLIDVDIDSESTSSFSEVLRLEREAIERGYPVLK